MALVAAAPSAITPTLAAALSGCALWGQAASAAADRLAQTADDFDPAFRLEPLVYNERPFRRWFGHTAGEEKIIPLPVDILDWVQVVPKVTRNLSYNAQNYTGPWIHAVEITLRSGTVYRFAAAPLTFLGKTYDPYLAGVEPIEYSRTLKPDSTEISLFNADLFVGAKVAASPFDGATAVLKRLLLGIDEEMEMLRGIVTEEEQREDAVMLRVVSELDPGQLVVQERNYSALCAHRFNAAGCGYREDLVAPSLLLADKIVGPTTAPTLTTITVDGGGLGVDTYKDKWVVLKGAASWANQIARIRTHSATVITLYDPLATLPPKGVNFDIYDFPNGAPFFVPTGLNAAGMTGAVQTGNARYVENTAWTLIAGGMAGHWLRIISGAGSGQRRKIGTNTGVRITLDSAEADFNPAPDNTSVVRVLYRTCPKDTASCALRARLQDFGGFPTLTLLVSQSREGRGGGGGRGDGLGWGRGLGRDFDPLLP